MAEFFKERLQIMKSMERATKYIQMAMFTSECMRRIKNMVKECFIGLTCPDLNANIIEEAGGPGYRLAKALTIERMVSLNINSGDIYHG
jgi:hypothetical protein